MRILMKKEGVKEGEERYYEGRNGEGKRVTGRVRVGKKERDEDREER